MDPIGTCSMGRCVLGGGCGGFLRELTQQGIKFMPQVGRGSGFGRRPGVQTGGIEPIAALPGLF